jgi:CRISPR-associated protein Csm1
MSVQIFLQGKLLGIDQFLVSQAQTGQPAGQALVAGRAHWVTLLSEVLPRALLAELGLARILLGSSGGGKFLVVLPQEALPAAQAFLESASRALETMSAHNLRLVWASTENLGDWTIVRKRLAEEMWRREHTAPVPAGEDAFRPRARAPLPGEDDYFENYLAPAIHGAEVLGWSPETPGRVLVNEGKHTWSTSAGDGVHIARKTALDEAGVNPASTAELAARAAGKPAWGILRGEVDGFSIRLRRAQTIEEHLQLAVAFKQFFAGELEVACTMPDFWRKVSILSSGEDDFAVYGAWDALLQLARELQRLFHRFAEANLKELPGPEGKTITMALELAPEVETPFATVLEAARRNLDIAKAADKDCLHIFGRTVEWRHVNHANDLKEMMLRMVRRFHCPPAFLEELSGFYREKPAGRADRPWRYYRRLAVVLGDFKDRELQRLQKALITDIVGKSATQVKLRPAGRVAVEWARLLVGPMQFSSLEEAPALTPEAVEAEAFAPYFSSVDGAEAGLESSAGIEAVSVAEPEATTGWQPEAGTALEPEPEPEPAPAPEPEISSPPPPEEETAGA